MSTASSPMRSLERAIDVLEVLDSARGSLRLHEIAKRAVLPVATTQRILAVLEARDRVEHDAYGYRPGIALTFGAHAFSSTNPLIRAARPILMELAGRTGFAATLYCEHKGQRVALSRDGGSGNFGYELVVGSRLPLYNGGGKALLAKFDEDYIKQVLEDGKASGEVVPEFDALMKDLEEVRQRGYSVSRGEREPGIASVAAVIPSTTGPLAAIQVTGTLDEFPEDKTPSMGRSIIQAAIAIGHGLPG